MQRRNLVLLVFCQLISATGSIVFVTLGGAFLGPEIAIRSQHWMEGVPYAGA